MYTLRNCYIAQFFWRVGCVGSLCMELIQHHIIGINGYKDQVLIQNLASRQALVLDNIIIIEGGILQH